MLSSSRCSMARFSSGMISSSSSARRRLGDARAFGERCKLGFSFAVFMELLCELGASCGRLLAEAIWHGSWSDVTIGSWLDVTIGSLGGDSAPGRAWSDRGRTQGFLLAVHCSQLSLLKGVKHPFLALIQYEQFGRESSPFFGLW